MTYVRRYVCSIVCPSGVRRRHFVPIFQLTILINSNRPIQPTTKLPYRYLIINNNMPALPPKSPSQSSLTSYSKNYYLNHPNNQNNNNVKNGKTNQPASKMGGGSGGGGGGSSSNNSGSSMCGFRSIVLIILGLLAMMMLYNVQSGLASLIECQSSGSMSRHHHHHNNLNHRDSERGTEEFLMDAPLEMLLLRAKQLQQSMAAVAADEESLDDDSDGTTPESTTTPATTTTTQATIFPPPLPSTPQTTSLPPPPLPLSFSSSPSIFPLPRTTTKSTLAVFVLSRREAFDLRQTIRDTWAAGHDNVYFVVGQPCSIPPAYRGVDPGGNSYCIPKQHHVIHRLQEYVDATMTHLSQQEQVAHRLRAEQDQYHDILLMQPDHVFTTATNNNNNPNNTTTTSSSYSFLTYAQHSNAMIDMYRTLPHKLKTAYHFVSHHLPSTIQWVLKVDDDFYVRIDAMERQLNQLTFPQLPFSTRSRFSSIPTIPIPPAQLPMVISGDIRREHKAFTSGKWKEISQYPPGKEYPPFPLGSYGHVVTRPIVEYVTKYRLGLLDYQGEDVSLGIWLDQVEFSTPYPSSTTATATTTTSTTTGMAGFFSSQKKSTLPPPLPQNITVTTTFLNWPDFMSNKGDCRKPLLHVVGHDVSSAKMKVCHRLDQSWSASGGTPASLTAAEAALFAKPQLQQNKRQGGGTLLHAKTPAGGTLIKGSQGRISTLKDFLLGQGKLKA